MTLREKTFSGIKWIFILNICQKAVSFGTTVILARILQPADFGLFALAFVLIDALGLFKSLGIDYALIRRKDDSDFEKAANTAFIIIPIFGLFIFALLYFIAPLGAKFLGNSSLTAIVRMLGLIFIIGCFGRVPDAILNRNMLFKQRSIAEIIGGLMYSGCAVILALAGLGVWSLVIGYVLQVFMQISCYWYFAKWRPRFEFSKQLAWEMIHYGKYIVAGSLVMFLRSNLDNLMIGKLLGVAQLGFYALAFNLANFGTDYLIGRLSRVLFPAFSKMQHDKEYFAEAFLRVLKYTSLIAVPFGMGLFLVAPAFLKTVYGDKWLAAEEVLKVLAIAGIFRAIGSSLSPAILAAGKSKLDFYLSLLQALVFFGLLIPAVYYFKILGAGYAVMISAIITLIIGFWRIRKILQFTFSDLINSLKPAMVSSLIMVLIIKLTEFVFLQGQTFNLSSLIITITLSCITYGISLILLNKPLFKEFKELVFLRTLKNENAK